MDYNKTYNWTSSTLASMRKSITGLGFKEIVPAITSKRFEPGANHSLAILGNREVPKIKEKDSTVFVNGWKKYYLPVSHVVEKQMSLEFLEKVYCLAPCLRLLMEGEDKSGKHLFNFFQFEIEWRTESMDSVFETGENFLNNVAKELQKNIESNSLIQNKMSIRNLNSLAQENFPTIKFTEALKLLGKDLTPEEDTKLSMLFDKPFWIYDYPEGVRDSIYHKNTQGTYDTYDLMLPFGYGELTTGGIRCKSGSDIIEQSKKLGKTYDSKYADWKDNVQIQTAGFGIGLERLLRFIAGADTILDFVQYHDDGPNKEVNSSFF